jgi:CxxC-x17-CxxC domain-containing protein
MAFQDQNLTCQDCGKQFVWSAEDQEFYAERGLQQPKRCKDCRQARKAQQGGGTRQMYPAVCSGCGAKCEVPFEPRGDRPVYCNECYRKQREGGQPTQVFPPKQEEAPKKSEE